MATIRSLRNSRSAAQQPDWAGNLHLPEVRRELVDRPPLTRVEHIDRLRKILARVATRKYRVIIAGDCAEDPEERSESDVREDGAGGDARGGLKMNTRRPVVRVGRIGGQFTKPRSKGTEKVGDLELPVYRGHMVNAPEPDPGMRAPDPRRMLSCYASAQKVFSRLWSEPSRGGITTDGHVWTSHEALLLGYEVPMLRTSSDGRFHIGSTHWPWIGDRTREPKGATRRSSPGS